MVQTPLSQLPTEKRGVIKICGWFVLGLCTIGGTLFSQEPAAEPRVILNNPPPTPTSSSAEREAAPPTAARGLNSLVLAVVQGMPAGGTYRTSQNAVMSLRSAIQATDSRLVLDPARATPSFCSGATYLVFVSVLDQLNRGGRIPIDRSALAALLVQEHQPDGAGIWGRWNANGPGTARLFHEADLGRNFTSFADARPGDFMKVFWNDEIGSKEAGHSVIYLGTVTRPDGEYVEYWSSNIPDGFGVRQVPRQRIHRQLFSRLEHPENVARLASLPSKDSYLASMLKRTSTPDEMLRMVGATDTGDTSPTSAAASRVPPTPASGKSPTATPVSAPGGQPTPKRSFLNRLFKHD